MRARKTKAQLVEARKCPADGGEHEQVTELADSSATLPCYVFETRYSVIKVCHHVTKCSKCSRLLNWSVPGDQCPDLAS